MENSDESDERSKSLLYVINDDGADSVPSSSSWPQSSRKLALKSLDIECDSCGELVDSISLNGNEQPYTTINNV